ncbi:hypothetical protein M9458_057652, partial [Cirrhinus mrigala]
RHLWLTLTDMRVSEKAQLLDAPISLLGLFGDAVGSFSEKFLESTVKGDEPFPTEERSVRCTPTTFQILFFAAFKKAQKDRCLLILRERGGLGASREAKSEAVPLPAALPAWYKILSSVPDCGVLRRKLPPGETDDEPLRKRVRLAAFHLPVPSHVVGNHGKCSFPIKFALKQETNTVQQKSSFPSHDGSQSHVISRVPFSDNTPKGASPAHSLSLSTSVSPAHAGGPVSAECFNDAPQVVSSSRRRAISDESRGHFNPSRTIWTRGARFQFACRPPRFSGVMMSDVQERDAPVLRAEIRSLLAKQAIEVVPPENTDCGLYSRYFLVPKKNGGLRPILDLRPLIRALAKREFKMITVKQIQPGDWFISVDLKDAYFHIQIAPRHRRFLRFAFEGRAYQFKVLPFGLALAPRTFTKCINAALSPLRQSGILNYLDDWLVIAQSWDTLENHKCQLLEHLKRLGLTINVQKSKLRPMQNIAFLGMDLDSRSMRARLSQERMQSLISSLTSFKPGRVVVLKCFQRLSGHMAAAALVCQLRLLHMRPLQLWLKSRVPSNAWKSGHLRVLVTRNACRRWPPGSLDGQSGQQENRYYGCLLDGLGSPLLWQNGLWHVDEHASKVAYKLPRAEGSIFSFAELSSTDKGSTRPGSDRQHDGDILHQPSGRYSVTLASKAGGALPPLGGQKPSVNSSSSCSRRSELWRGHAVQRGSGSWRVEAAPTDHSDDFEPVRRGGVRLVCLRGKRALSAVLLTDERASAGGCSLESLAQEAQICISPSEDYAASAAENQRREGDCASGSAELAQPAVVSGVGRAPDGSPVADSVTERSLISGKRLGVAPQAGAMEPACLAGERRGQTLNVSQRFLDTIAEARAPSTRRLYSLKWKVFSSWCITKDEDPASCDVSIILSFLQDCLDAGRTPSTLKVYVAAISAFHLPIGDRSVGRHHLVTSFLRGARRLRPFRPNMVPVWDLSLVLSSLAEPPFEPLLSAELKVLSFKTALLLALACGSGRVTYMHCLRTLRIWSSVRMTVCLGCSLQIRVSLIQRCSEGRKENDWFTDSTNEIEAEAGSGNLDVWREYFRQKRY